MSSVNKSDALALLGEFKKLIEKVLKKKMDTVVQVASASVVSVSGGGEVTVRLTNSPTDGSQDFVAPNQSGVTLVANDIVTLFYWGDYSSARIFIKN